LHEDQSYDAMIAGALLVEQWSEKKIKGGKVKKHRRTLSQDQ
jgi:hypothetical protein